ncbi:MAG: tetratricopeptide repeat protein [bacterium]|nr:tetratricopeptide repeat protein [bacterium]
MADAHSHFKAGLKLLAQRKYQEATGFFKEAMRLDNESGAMRPQMRYRSYFGLCRALADRPTHDHLRLCKEAADADNFDPVLQLNLAKVYARAGRTTQALATIQRGLRLDPGHEGLTELLAKVDRRAPPILPRLGRDHAINRSIGRLRTLSLFRGSRAS